MKRLHSHFLSSFLVIFLFCSFQLNAQHIIRFQLKTEDSTFHLRGANALIKTLKKTAIADSQGIVEFRDLPNGNITVVFTHTGFEEQKVNVSVPNEAIIEVEMELAEEHEEEVIVMATRSSRTIYDLPTRVEVISGEELDEKANMKPGEIRMLLNESTGIQTQQTSATSYNSSIRIQGLDGRYTQLLRDGYPLYGGFSGGLSLMQVSPLDLKQVEVIKGSVSTLYGGGAIAGLVNLVSKTPGEKRELNFLANGTSAAGFDVSGFYSEKFKTTGITLFGSVNHGEAYDPSDVGFTAIPMFDRFTVHPRFFLYGKNTTMDAGIQFMTEDRMGGDYDQVKGRIASGYFESNKTQRITANWGIDHIINENQKLDVKTSYSYFDRRILTPQHNFTGFQKTFFSELNYVIQKNKSLWIAGLNFTSDQFEERPVNNLARDYSNTVTGLFLQNNLEVSEKLSFEAGLRTDHTTRFGWEILPRLSVLYEPSSKLTFRIGGGKGYKLPGLFTEESEKLLFRNLAPLDAGILSDERSAGGNLDVNYRTNIGDVDMSVNQLFFYTRIDDPLIIEENPAGNFYFNNANGYMDTKGIETNIKLVLGSMKLFVGYTYTDANTKYDTETAWLPLTARHRLNNVLMFEKEDNFRIGLEGYFFGPQKLSDGARGDSYWIFGLMAEKIFHKFSVFLNFENFTDTRQTKMGSIYTGSFQSPVFRDIYAPLDGFVVNGGMKIRL